MSDYIPMGVALMGWIALWVYLFSLDQKIKSKKIDHRRIKKDA